MHPPPPPPPARRSSVARGDSAQPAILGGAGTATLRSAPRLPPRGLRGRSASSLVRPCPGAATRRWHRRAPSERRATAGASSVYRLMIPSQPSPRKARAQMKECHKSPLPKKKKKSQGCGFAAARPLQGKGRAAVQKRLLEQPGGGKAAGALRRGAGRAAPTAGSARQGRPAPSSAPGTRVGATEEGARAAGRAGGGAGAAGCGSGPARCSADSGKVRRSPAGCGVTARRYRRERRSGDRRVTPGYPG